MKTVRWLLIKFREDHEYLQAGKGFREAFKSGWCIGGEIIS
ncbi:MAG: hypothetical protein QXN75_03085 [Thermoproteota archaeon]